MLYIYHTYCVTRRNTRCRVAFGVNSSVLDYRYIGYPSLRNNKKQKPYYLSNPSSQIRRAFSLSSTAAAPKSLHIVSYLGLGHVPRFSGTNYGRERESTATASSPRGLYGKRKGCARKRTTPSSRGHVVEKINSCHKQAHGRTRSPSPTSTQTTAVVYHRPDTTVAPRRDTARSRQKNRPFYTAAATATSAALPACLPAYPSLYSLSLPACLFPSLSLLPLSLSAGVRAHRSACSTRGRRRRCKGTAWASP